MREDIVLIGAGSAMFTRGLVADLVLRGEPSRLALVDSDPDALDVAERLARKLIEHRGAPVELRASTDRRDVLPRATVVVCTVGVGGRRAWEADVLVARRYGVNLPVGDTVGPGGSSRALRMIPAMVAIAQDVVDLAPQALFFNYGNPMAPVCRGVIKATGARLVGLCHGVSIVARYLAGALGVDVQRLSYVASGINHLTWFTDVRVDGASAMARMREVAQEQLRSGAAGAGHHFAEAGTATRGAGELYAANPFSWLLFDTFGAFPAVLDRHVVEFFPQFFLDGSYYGRTLGVDAFSFERTIAYGDAVFAQMREEAYSPRPLPEDYFRRVEGEHEEVLDIVAAIRSGATRVFSANLPNVGQAPSLPAEAIVEGPAVTTPAGLVALPVPALPAALTGTLATRYAWVETIVEAALERSYDKLVQALALDGWVRSIEDARSLARELLDAQAQHLDWAQEPAVASAP